MDKISSEFKQENNGRSSLKVMELLLFINFFCFLSVPFLTCFDFYIYYTFISRQLNETKTITESTIKKHVNTTLQLEENKPNTHVPDIVHIEINKK